MISEPGLVVQGEPAAAGPPSAVPAPRWRTIETLSTLATRLSFLAIAWLVLGASHDWVRVGLVLTVQAGVYLVVSPLALRLPERFELGRLVVATQLVSALAVAAVAFCYTSTVPLLIAVAIVGALRAATDVVTNALTGAAGAGIATLEDDDRAAPPREWAIRGCLLVAGAGLGFVANALGASGTLWLIALMFALCAGLVVLAAPPRTRELAAVPATDDAAPRQNDQLALRLALVLVGTSLFACLAAVTLVVAWLGLDSSPRHLGLLGGAFALGTVGGGAFFSARAGSPARAFMLTAGFVIGGGAVAVSQDLRPTQILVVAVAAVAGVAVSSVTPVIGVVMSPRIPSLSRERAGTFAAVVSIVGLLIGVWIAAWISVRATVGAAVAVSAVGFLVAMLIPTIWMRTWRQLTPVEVEHPPVLRRTARLAGRLSITLTYADGQWLVEVRKGRALLGTRHMVKSTEALNMLALLDDPALNRTLEETVNTDQTEAVRQVDRMRTELAELEVKLTGLTEMRDYGESRKLD